MTGAKTPTAAKGFGRRVGRNLGYIACLVGALVMISGRFMPGAPRWLVYAGVSVIVFGWGLFALTLFRRATQGPAPAPGRENMSAKS